MKLLESKYAIMKTLNVKYNNIKSTPTTLCKPFVFSLNESHFQYHNKQIVKSINKSCIWKRSSGVGKLEWASLH